MSESTPSASQTPPFSYVERALSYTHIQRPFFVLILYSSSNWRPELKSASFAAFTLPWSSGWTESSHIDSLAQTSSGVYPMTLVMFLLM